LLPKAWKGKLFPETYWLPLHASGEETVAPLTETGVKPSPLCHAHFPKIDGKEMTLCNSPLLPRLSSVKLHRAKKCPCEQA
jgi:hypothetical protein